VIGETLDHQLSQIGSDGGHFVVILLEDYIPHSHGIKGAEALDHLWDSNVQLIEKLLDAVRRALGEAGLVNPTRWQKGSWGLVLGSYKKDFGLQGYTLTLLGVEGNS